MGAIGSNGNVEGSGNTNIYGDVAYGPTGSIDIDPDKVTGGVYHLSEERDFPPIPSFDVGSNNVTLRNKSDANVIWPGTYGKVTIGKDVTFMPGDYYIDELEVSSQGKMIIAGGSPTNMFIKTSFDMSGQAEANDPAHPENLTVFFDGTSTIKWPGGIGVSASIYAPKATLELTGGTEYSGSFIADVVKTIGNAKIHFDQGSMNRHLWPRPFRIITWAQSID
jgi:hypothetical protein